MQGRTRDPIPNADNSPIILEDASPRVSGVVAPRPTTPSRGPSINKDSGTGKPPTKSQNLKRVGDDILEMLYEFKSMTNRRSTNNMNLVSIESQEKLNEAKV